MNIHTSAIILSYLKYGDSSAIVRFFTKEQGFKTLIWKGVFSSKSKHKGVLQPLREVQIYYRDKGGDSLSVLQKINSDNLNIGSEDVSKNLILLFLSEVLSSLLQNEQESSELYQLITAKIREFYAQKNTQLWVQQFLLELSPLLGILPDKNYVQGNRFDLESGVFTSSVSYLSLSEQESELWARFLNNNFNSFQAFERLQILDIWMNYFQSQINGFRQPKSLGILKELFT